MKSRRVQCSLPLAVVLGLLVALVASALSARAGIDRDDDEFQLNVNPHLQLTDQWSTFGNLGYYENPDYAKYRFGWPGLVYRLKPWAQLLGGLDSYYTDNFSSANTLELRPFAGVKLFVPNATKIQLYNLTRFEYRAFENLDTHVWSDYGRLRTRFGMEAPLTSRARAWTASTAYVLTDVEPFYRFDTSEWDPVRVRAGLGYILNDRVRIELIYTAEFSRSSPGRSLEYADNIIQLNIKIALRKGILERLFNPGS